MTRGRIIILILLQVLVVFAGACKKDVAGGEGAGQQGSGQEQGYVEPSEPFSLKVATYNVLKPSGRRSEMQLSSETVRNALGTAIAATGADLIAFNELDNNYIPSGVYSLKTLSNLPVYWKWSLEWPNKIPDEPPLKYSYANGFAYNSTVLTLKESGYVWLSKETMAWYTDSSKAHNKAGSPERTCVWARFVHNATKGEFYLFVTHLATKDQGGAQNMASVVNSFAASKAGNARKILCGDMNSAPSSDYNVSAPYKALKAYWTDAYEKVSADGNIGTYANYPGTLSGSSASYYYDIETFTDGHPERRIDHIMTNGACKATTYSTVKTTYTLSGETWAPSDHLPVVATIEF